jgi:large subunit ribosomal protein L21
VYAVVRTGGKQYRVEEGRSIKVDRLPGEAGDSVELGDVLLMGEGESITFGAPTIAGARVLGTIAEQGRASKIVVFRYKAKTRSRKKTGHRQAYTRLVVSDILAAGEQPRPKEARAPKPAAAVAAPAEDVATEPAPAEEKPKRPRRKATAETATETDTPAPEAKPKRSRKKATE